MTIADPNSPRAFGGANSRPDPETVEERHYVEIPVRDGTVLIGDLYMPRGGSAVPVVVSITPYGRTMLRGEGRWFALNGYAYLAVDQRGRYDSGGVYDTFDAVHKIDGYDVVEWAAAQEWCTGKVGMVGHSATGWTTWWTANAAPPHLAAIMPATAPADNFLSQPYIGGTLVGGWWLDWSAAMAGRAGQACGATNRIREFRRLPYAEINRARGSGGTRDAEWWGRHLASDPYWEAIAYQGEDEYRKVTVPSLGVSGWFDGVYTGTPMNFVGMRRHGTTPEARAAQMIVGPWLHGVNQRLVSGVDFGEDAIIDLDGMTLRWFDRHLKGVDNGVDREAPVKIFVMGENAWHEETDWPIADAVPTPFHLASGGRLLPAVPEDQGADTYLYDPRNPTIDPGHLALYADGDHADYVRSDQMFGPLDTRPSIATGGVLTWWTEPLEHPVEVTGPIEAVLYAATTARDTDWFVRLVDIHPDGRSLLLAEGALRARHRDPERDGRFNGRQLSQIVPDHVYRYTVEFWRDTANLFLPGHRIGVEISSSWYPNFLPNLGSGHDIIALVDDESAIVVATQTIHHGPTHPSHIMLPLLDRAKRGVGA
jgi:putative CocE/NonD family hydrolase